MRLSNQKLLISLPINLSFTIHQNMALGSISLSVNIRNKVPSVLLLFRLLVTNGLILLPCSTKLSTIGRLIETLVKKALIGNFQASMQELNSTDFTLNPFFPFNGFDTVLSFTRHYDIYGSTTRDTRKSCTD